jgi:MSHA biogenesis protein MshK
MRAAAVLLACAVGGMPSLLSAQTDPMRPPQGLLAPQAGGGTGAVAGTGGQRLAAIMLSKDRKFAVIDGQEVALGGRLGDARLVRLTETEATLRSRTETVVLKLGPDLKTPVAPAKSQKEAKK